MLGSLERASNDSWAINLHEELPMASRHPLRRTTARNTKPQESAEKNYSKKYQASRIHREETQQEYTNSFKNPLRIHRRRKWRQDTRQEETQPRRESSVRNLWDPALVVSKNTDDDEWNKLPHNMCGME